MKKKNQILETIGHLIEEQPEPQKKEAPAEPVPETPVKPQNRNRALVIYLSLLFSVAFVLVLVSLIIQQQNYSQTLNQVNENASSALSHAEKLQSDNRQLLADKEALNDKLEILEGDLETLNAELAEAAQREKDHLSELEAREAALDQEKQDKETIQKAYELLIAAQRCLDQELTPDFEEAMRSLEPLKDHLDTFGQTLYEELLAQLPAQTEE